MNFNVSKCCSIHFTQATTHKMENTHTSMIHHCYPPITLIILVSLCSPIWDMMPDITAKATKKCQNFVTSTERTCIQGLSPTPARLCLHCIVLLGVDDVEKVQHHSTHYIYNDYRSDYSVSTTIKVLYWDSFEIRLTKSSLVMIMLYTVCKIFNNLAAIPYHHYVKPMTNSITRHSHQYKISALKMFSRFFLEQYQYGITFLRN